MEWIGSVCVGWSSLLCLGHVFRVSAPQLLLTPGDLYYRDGNHGMGLWLGIMGEVYDVSAGQRHYGEAGRESARLGELCLKGLGLALRLALAAPRNGSNHFWILYRHCRKAWQLQILCWA